MNELTDLDALEIINCPGSNSEDAILRWFRPELIPYMFPIDRRPTISPVPELDDSELVLMHRSSRRGEDEVRRKAMHDLIVTWEKSAKDTSHELLNVLYRGGRSSKRTPESPPYGLFTRDDSQTVSKYLSLIPDLGSDCTVGAILSQFQPQASIPVFSPKLTIGGYTVTETVGPLAMLSELVRTRETAVVWVKEKFQISHGRRRVRIQKREGTIALFDRFMNIAFVPSGSSPNEWIFIRGSVIALIQRLRNRRN